MFAMLKCTKLPYQASLDSAWHCKQNDVYVPLIPMIDNTMGNTALHSYSNDMHLRSPTTISYYRSMLFQSSAFTLG